MTAIVGPYTRHEDWIDGLAYELRHSRDLPFEWGQNDCLQFVGRCIEAMSGINPLAPHLKAYRSPLGATRVLRQLEGVSFPVGLADKLWGLRLPIAFARMGDVVSADLGQPAGMGPCLGMCYGRRSLFVGVSLEDCGLVHLDTINLGHCYQPWAS